MRTLAFLFLFLAAAPKAEIRHFRFDRPVQTGGQSGGQTCFVVDPGVFAHAAPELADVRLYRGTTETPYVVRVAAPVSSLEQEIAPLNLGRNAGKTVFDAAMPAGSYSDVQVAVNAHDFIATAAVSGSQQQSGTPETSLGEFTMFDLTKQRLGRSTVLHLPRSDFRFLHFRITGPIAPENITGISAAPEAAGEPKYSVVAEFSRITQKGHSSIVEFEIPAHTPVERVAFIVGPQPANFSRDVDISIQPEPPSRRGEDVRPIPPVTYSGNILRLHRVESGHRIDEERLAVDARNATFDPATKWTVAIDNGDDAPLSIHSVRLEMLERNICFDAAGAGPLAMYYGDAALTAPQYDYARLFAPQPGAAVATLGPEQQNAAYEPRPDDRPFTERHPALLWMALGGVVLLLGWVALRSAKGAVAPK